MDILNKKYTNRAYLKILELKMKANHQVKYIILDDFLDPEFYENLMKEIDSKKHILVGDTAGRQIHYVSGDFSKMFWTFYLGPSMREFLSNFYGTGIQIEGLLGGRNIFQKFLNIFFRKRGMFLRKNMPHSELEWHTDGPQSKIAGSFILYLNSEWSNDWGGNLELGQNTSDGIQPYNSVTPIGNRCVLLMCEKNKSWHRVTSLGDGNYRQFIHYQILYLNS